MAYELPQQIANKVKNALADQELTQSALAAHLGVSQSMISRRLAGVYAWPLHELAPLAEFLGISVNELLSSKAA